MRQGVAMTLLQKTTGYPLSNRMVSLNLRRCSLVLKSIGMACT
jgi:hypothetical protein